MAMRERILVFGGPGAGKSRGWLSIARRYPKSKVWVLDTDDAAERMLASYDLPNVTVKPCLEWEDYIEAAAEARAELGPDDWFVVDMMSSAWDAVQRWYLMEVYGLSRADFLMASRKQSVSAGKTKAPAIKDLGPEWTVINAQYQVLMAVIKQGIKAHTYLTASAKAPHPEYTSLAIKTLFAGLPMIPGGQKDLAYEVHTVLLLEHPSPEQWVYSVVKDRERGDGKPTVREQLGDFGFAFQYVEIVCGHVPPK